MTLRVRFAPCARGLVAAALCTTALAGPAAAAVSCTLSASTLSFGAYDPISKAEVDSNTPLTLSCSGTGTITYTVTISPGQSGDQENRYLLSGASNKLIYQIYLETQHQNIFGDGTGNTMARTNTTSFNGPASRTGYAWGVLMAGQIPKPGNYSDTLTVTVTY